MLKSTFKSLPSILLNLLVLQLAKLAKFSLLIGSTGIFFSLTNIVGPMIGIMGGFTYSVNFFAIQFLYKVLFASSIGIGYHIPQFFASAYWLTTSKYLRLVVPAVCMILFIAHPIGNQAYVYSMFWLIPIVISFVGFNNIFLRSLGSTFVAHAVGSVIWIYTVPMVSTQWISLIPIVVVERFLFATGMVAVYYALKFIKTVSINNFSLSFSRVSFLNK